MMRASLGLWALLAAGCADAWVAWLLNLGVLALGLLAMPRRTLRAFLRGRYSRSLYRHGDRDLERETVAELRAFTGLDQSPGPWRARDVGWLIFFAAVAMIWGALQLALALLPLAGLGWLLWWAIHA